MFTDILAAYIIVEFLFYVFSYVRMILRNISCGTAVNGVRVSTSNLIRSDHGAEDPEDVGRAGQVKARAQRGAFPQLLLSKVHRRSENSLLGTRRRKNGKKNAIQKTQKQKNEKKREKTVARLK